MKGRVGMGQQERPGKNGKQEDGIQKRPGKNRKRAYGILAAVCGAVAVFCLAWLAKYLLDVKRGRDMLAELADNYVETQVPESEASAPPQQVEEGTEESAYDNTVQEAQPGTEEAGREELLGKYGVPEKEIDFAALQAEQNPDIYAWITIPGTRVDYPVLQHPEELDYYLDYNIDGTRGYPGCIYTQMMNSKDFTDPNTVLYGHNMKDGSMFADLHYYGDSEFFGEHPYVFIYTEDSILVYRIFAAYEFSNVHLLYTFDLSTPEAIGDYAKNIFNIDGMNNQFDESLEPELGPDSRIITLSTCISGKADRRWLVAAVLEEEIAQAGAGEGQAGVSP